MLISAGDAKHGELHILPRVMIMSVVVLSLSSRAVRGLPAQRQHGQIPHAGARKHAHLFCTLDYVEISGPWVGESKVGYIGGLDVRSRAPGPGYSTTSGY